MFAEEGGANRRTARERLTVHVTNEVCAGCHSLMDPIGLALEKMDGIGAYRETENGAAIDPSGELNGVPFADAVELGRGVVARSRARAVLRREPVSVRGRPRHRRRRTGVARRASRRELDDVGLSLARSAAHDRDERRVPHDIGRARRRAADRDADARPERRCRAADGADGDGHQRRPERRRGRRRRPRGPDRRRRAGVTFQQLQDEIFTPALRDPVLSQPAGEARGTRPGSRRGVRESGRRRAEQRGGARRRHAARRSLRAREQLPAHQAHAAEQRAPSARACRWSAVRSARRRSISIREWILAGAKP